MDRDTYVQVLRAVAYELMGLVNEWVTDDGEFIDDAVDDELQAILMSLEDFINKLKPRIPA